MFTLWKRLVTHQTFVSFLSTMSSAVFDELARCSELFAADTTLKRFLSWMTSPVLSQIIFTYTTSATLCALVFAPMNIHVTKERVPRWITFLALSARIPVFCNVPLLVNFQRIFCTTQIQPQRVIIWTLSVIKAISFSLYFTETFTCIMYTTQSKSLETRLRLNIRFPIEKYTSVW